MIGLDLLSPRRVRTWGRGGYREVPPLADRIDADGSCWIWTGAITAHGYGTVGIDGRTRPVHRVVYEALTGEAIPDGLDLDHLCRVRSCVNPDHLEPVSRSENVRRSSGAFLENSRRSPAARGDLR